MIDNNNNYNIFMRTYIVHLALSICICVKVDTGRKL